jgi:phosphoesterase RecJ-like protein
MTTDSGDFRRVCDQLRQRQRFIITSHVRPDGDAIGSALALAWALRAMGKHARVVNRDPAPAPLSDFAGPEEIIVADNAPRDADAVVVLECGDLARTGLGDLDGRFILNIDHHPGNTGFGDVCWFDGTAAALGEMIVDLIDALGVPLTPEMATQLYIAIVTDTGSFRYPGVSPRTFTTTARLVAAGANPVTVAGMLYDSSTLGRVRLQGALLHTMEVHHEGRIATLYLDETMLAASGGTAEDTDGLINLPLSVRTIQAVVFFKEAGDGQFRVSLRSKGDIDVGSIARAFGGGGHKNASGCTIAGPLQDARDALYQRLAPEVARGVAALGTGGR